MFALLKKQQNKGSKIFFKKTEKNKTPLPFREKAGIFKKTPPLSRFRILEFLVFFQATLHQKMCTTSLNT
ncbi:hypothetical protein K737_300981 [Holospora undulata HU1]|uniref:Uncharacterized protein n=1 Tax=Holospora undulata HU1 TaxID=1321371 RepID=A0A061JFW9_9PROT|nr:hypothetical protein K737_300981 [Holospora undulata HU1]